MFHPKNLLKSRRFKFAIVAFVVLAVVLDVMLDKQENPIDWTSRGLNPDAPGFKPQVVILSGTFSYWINDPLEDRVKSGNSYFEIRMRGADYYYCRKWNKAEWKVGTWFHLELAVPDFAMSWGMENNSFEVRGGGGSWLGRPEDLVLARRLWSGTNFIGAKADEPTAEEREWHVSEEFKNLEKVGPYLIPKRIDFSAFNGAKETYTIKKIEFWNQPSTNWFWDVKKKYFDRSPTMRTNDLHEPGTVR